MRSGTNVSTVPKAAMAHDQPVMYLIPVLYGSPIMYDFGLFLDPSVLMCGRFCAPRGRTMELLSFLEDVISKPRCGLCYLVASQCKWPCMMPPSRRLLGSLK